MAVPLRDAVATKRFPWITVALIAANVIVFLFLQPSASQDPPRHDDHSLSAYERTRAADEFTYRWGAIACEVTSGKPRIDEPVGCPPADGAPLPSHKLVYLALLTSLFVHANVAHIGGNLLFLWVFGNNVEDRLGRLGFLLLYLVGGVVSSLGFMVFSHHAGEPLIGASGAIAVAMGAYLVFHPRGQVLTAVLAGTVQLVYLPAAVVLVLFFVTQFFTGDEGVAWQAHAVGMGFGFLVALGLSRLPALRERARRHDEEAALHPWEAF